MVSKINEFDYKNATVNDYKKLALIFYKNASKKYQLDLNLRISNNCSFCNANSQSQFCDILGNPKFIHYVNIYINNFYKNIKNDDERFFEFIATLYHELFHVLTMEKSNIETNYSLTSLFSVLIDYNYNGRNFWQYNYKIIDEEIMAYIYEINNTNKFMLKHFPEFDTLTFSEECKIKYLTMKNFYNYYIYDKKRYTKNELLIHLINNLQCQNNIKYPAIINKVYDSKNRKVKNIDELINDFKHYYYQFQDNHHKISNIKNFYCTLTTEMYKTQKKTNYPQEISYFLKLRLKKEQQQLENLIRIKPQKLNLIKKQNIYINKQYNTIKDLKLAINSLK